MVIGSLTVTSKAFKDGEMIPSVYTADGKNISPDLEIEGVLEGAKSLVIIVDDPDAPMGTWTHWVVFNIDARNSSIPEAEVPGIQGLNDFKKVEYGGPAPPSGTHRYFFKAYALDIMLDLKEGALLKDVRHAMNGHVIAEGELEGKYSKE